MKAVLSGYENTYCQRRRNHGIFLGERSDVRQTAGGTLRRTPAALQYPVDHCKGTGRKGVPVAYRVW